ncbi:PepSY-associated TM helix domain-containing protein [soil metagenome]
MELSKPVSYNMRILHRYTGFFLAGIMAVYALSGIVLIFRETDFLKKETKIEKKLDAGIQADELGKQIRVRELKFTKTEGDLQYFEQGTYNSKTGVANYTSKDLPFVLNKLTQLHKASTKQPLYFFNIFFAVSLLFLVVSSFWMFKPSTKIFKKGMYFTIAGKVLMLILLYV